ncbi:MAG: TonB-dependent receptor [Myxococcales bacterium]|nr:TonB-dependent receptor [Myxococcales bacterium]
MRWWFILVAAALGAPAAAQTGGAGEADAPPGGDEAAAAEGEPPAEGEAAPQITPPELVEFVEADYPAEARAQRLTGSVLLMITIEADGSVSAAEVTEPAGDGFDEAALAAVKQFRFTPAKVDGEPTAVQVAYRYNFTLAEEVVETPAAPTEVPTGRLVGRILERGTRKPLPGLQVKLEGTELEAFTDAEGRFRFEQVPAGEVIITMRDRVYASIDDAETIEDGKETDVSYYVEPQGFSDTLVVVGKRPKKEVVRRTVTVEEIRTIPGTSGDALAVVQNLPGSARTAFGQTDIILRGGGRSQAFLNTQPIPLAFHFGGLRSTVASALIESLDVYPGNYGVEFGRGNGGIVDIRLRRPKDDGIHGYVEADVFDAGALVEGPLGEGGALAVAVRRSYIDALLPVFAPDDVLDNITSAPRYYDAQILYDLKRDRHRLKLLVYGSSDTFESFVDEPPENNPFIRGEGELSLEWAGVQIEHGYRFSDTVQNTANVAYLISNNRAAIGPAFDLNFLFQGFSVRDAVDVELAEDYKLRAGLDVELLWADIDAFGAGGPPKEGEPGVELGAADLRKTVTTEFWATPALWVEGLLTFGPVLVVPGFRGEYFSSTGDFAPQPRLTSRWTMTPGTVLKGGVGLFAEPPEIDELNPELGNPDLAIETSIQYSLGIEQRLSEAMSIDVVGFFKSLDELITRVDDPEVLFANQGEGRAYGVEVLFRHDLTDRLYGWVAYTFQISERRDAPGEDYRLFDNDQTHNLIVIGQYRFTPRLHLGGRWRYTSGNPETPVRGAVYDADADIYVPLYGDVNSGRLPAFHQLDLRLDYWWVFDTWKLLTYLEVRNVYNRENAQSRQYNYDFSESQTQYELPIIPSFGIRGEW